MKERGHTLLEVLLSVLLLAAALLPLLGLYPQLLSANKSQRTFEMLGVVASGRLERLQELLKSGVAVASGSETCGAAPSCLSVWVVSDVQTNVVAGWLRQLEVVTCVDSNSDGACGPGEDRARYVTRVTSRP